MCTLNRYFLTVYLCHRVSTYVSLSAYKCLLFSFTLAIFLCCWLHFFTYFPFICSFRMRNEIKFIFHFESHSEIDISEFGSNQRIRKCKIYARQKLLSFFLSLSLSLSLSLFTGNNWCYKTIFDFLNFHLNRCKKKRLFYKQ